LSSRVLEDSSAQLFQVGSHLAQYFAIAFGGWFDTQRFQQRSRGWAWVATLTEHRMESLIGQMRKH